MTNSGKGPGERIVPQLQPNPLQLVSERGASKKNCTICFFSMMMRWYASVNPIASVSVAESKNTSLLGTNRTG